MEAHLTRDAGAIGVAGAGFAVAIDTGHAVILAYWWWDSSMVDIVETVLTFLLKAIIANVTDRGVVTLRAAIETSATSVINLIEPLTNGTVIADTLLSRVLLEISLGRVGWGDVIDMPPSIALVTGHSISTEGTVGHTSSACIRS